MALAILNYNITLPFKTGLELLEALLGRFSELSYFY